MEQKDRAMIDRCCEQFVPRINLFTLWPRLFENKIFNWDDVNVPSWEKKLDDPDTTRDILLTIKTRGPYALKNLALSLRQTDHHLLADILQGNKPLFLHNNDSSDNGIDSSMDGKKTDDASMDDDFHENLQYATEPLRINVRKATKFSDGPEYKNIGRYWMRSRPRGYVLIITIISTLLEKRREAAERDEASLQKLFTDMGFEVTCRTNLTGAEIKKIVKQFSQRDFRLIDSCFVIISAHGTETQKADYPETEIKPTDHGLEGAEKVYCSDIYDFFSAEHCKNLIGKPKIFIFQACRGGRQQVVPRIVTDGFESNVPPRNYSDMLIAHSTMPGHVAYRNTISGSWYIQILCEVFMNYACDMHIQDLFNKIDRRLMRLRTYDNRSQTSTVKSIGFNKHCYLNPGLFEDS